MDILLNTNDSAFKCAICNKPLSIPPVLHSPDLGNICGRCEDRCISEEKDGALLDRQIIYENIAKFITFPCAYHVFGCTSKLKWNSIKSHEQYCEFKNVVCPISHNGLADPCSWIGTHEDLPTHIKKDHKKYFSNPLQTVITKDLESRILFWEITGRLVVIILAYSEGADRYYCCISADFSLKICKRYKYQIEFGIDEWENPVILRKPNLELLYGNTFARADNSLEIPLDKIREMLQRSEEVTVKFTVIQKDEEIQSPTNTPANLSLNSKGSADLNESLLHDLECPVCVEYMTSPIYICAAGHNVCKICAPKIASCPICRGRMMGGRNFTLEKLTETLNYPCVNRPHGCGFVSALKKVKEHEKNCFLSQRDCFIAHCTWKGANLGLQEHIENNHPLLELNEVHAHKLQKKVDLYLLSFDNKIFILNMRFDINQPFEYSVQCLGSEEEKYMYELQIIGCSIMETKITLCHSCEPLPYSSGKRNVGEFEGLSLPFSFLCQFLTSFQEVNFKISIRRRN